jgi:predicted small secreted protein
MSTRALTATTLLLVASAAMPAAANTSQGVK